MLPFFSDKSSSNKLLSLTLTVDSTETSVESLCVDMADVLSVSSMKQLPFTISSGIFVPLLFSHHVRMVQMWILHPLDFLNIYCASGSLHFAQDILVLGGAWEKLYFVYNLRGWHWTPLLGEWNS